jgi:hypothetical protein
MSELLEGDGGELFEFDDDEEYQSHEPDISGDPDVLDVTGPVNDVFAQFKELRERNTAAQKEAKRLGAIMRKAKAELHDRMIDELGIDSIKVRGVGRFVAQEPTWYATVQDRAAFQRWARENRPNLLRTREEQRLLNNLIRDCVRDGRAFPPGLTGYPRKTVSVYKR